MGKKQEYQEQRLSLMDAFIVEKLKNYEEPRRKGTPRGERIGFSRKKYNAALLCLKNVPQKQLSKLVGISHGLFRKWRTEGEFLEFTDILEIEYSDYLVRHLKKRAEKQVELRDEYFNLTELEMINTPPPELSFNEFLDLKFYGPVLIVRIVRNIDRSILSPLSKKIKEQKHSRIDLALYYQALDLLGIISQYPFKKLNKQIQKTQTDNLELTQKHQQAVSLELLRRDLESTGEISAESLRVIIHTLHYSSDSFTPIDMEV